ncbi:MAG: IS21 family transposase [Polyangiaceae bacterium]
MSGEEMEAACAAAGMSVRTGQKWQKGMIPSASKGDRTWRTREDPFAVVWDEEVVPLLGAAHGERLEAKTIFEALNRKRSAEERFGSGQLRTLQRRIREWRAHHGAPTEVMFPQVHTAGRMGSFDFTHATELGVTIGGVLFVHLFFEFVLAFSGWRFVQLAFGETFEALLSGLQGAFFAAKGVPERVRLDGLSAATHELVKTGGRALTTRFAALVDHYGFVPSRIQPGEGHENGVAEKAHHLLKNGLDQELILRGSREFVSVDAYLAFVADVVHRKFHAGNEEKIALERAALRALPAMKVPEYSIFPGLRVSEWSTINVGGRIYSVPSRLKRHEVTARLHADFVDVRLGTKSVATMPRLRGDKNHRIDYRHVIWSLVQKPGAFAAYRFREDMFPSQTFREAYDRLRRGRGDRADVEYVRILHLAASTTERSVEEALIALLAEGEAFDYARVKSIAHPAEPKVPVVTIGKPDPGAYDDLLESRELLASGGAS